MRKFDKKVKKLSKEFQIPETYHNKVDEILETIKKDSVVPPQKKPFVKVIIAIAVICVFLIGHLCFSGSQVAEASLFETFKQTIMDFFGMNEEESQELGIESEKKEAISKPDLMIEMQEQIMDGQNIYVVVKITAPPEVEFKKKITFDYFGFCEGSNYNASKLLPGARDCTLLEVLEGRKNVATYVVNLSTSEQMEEGEEITVFFNNLVDDPYGDNPQLLVEGMWSVSFNASYTVSENIMVKGTEDSKYSFLDTTAAIKEIKLLPLGLTMISDVSNVPIDKLHTSDTRITVRLKMIDGSEILVDSPDPDAKTFTSSSSISEYEKKGKVYHKYVSQFKKAINISQVVGIYIEDCYMSFKNFE